MAAPFRHFRASRHDDRDGRKKVHAKMTSTDTDHRYVEVTLIRSDNPLTKTYTSIAPDGSPHVSGSPFLTHGTASRVQIPICGFAEEFSGLLADLHQNTCVTLGSLVDAVAGDNAKIVTRDRYQTGGANEGMPNIWRGKEWLGYVEGQPAVLGLDHDRKDIPDAVWERVQEDGGFFAILEAICPALSKASRVGRPSVSTGIAVTASGKVSAGGGLHMYLLILDGGDARDFAHRLHARLVLAGFCFPFVSKSGAIQIRSLVDLAASGCGDRLWFESKAVLRSDDLHHVAGARDPDVADGTLLDTRAALLPLSEAETDRLREVEGDLRASVTEVAQENRRQYREQFRDLIARSGGDVGSADGLAERLLISEETGVLTGNHPLYMDDGRVVTVAEVLSDRQAYHRSTCADPLEPDRQGGRNKAVIFTDGLRARVFTHRHGGRLFDLVPDEGSTAIVQHSQPGRELVRFEEGSHPTDRLLPSSPLDPDPAIDRLMRDFNDRFAVVADGGSASIVRLAFSAEMRRYTPVSMTVEGFKLMYGNEVVSLPSPKRDGVFEQVPAVNIWLRHPNRRTCPDGFALDPTNSVPATCWNRWQGYGVTEKPGDWSKLQRMIVDVLAAGNEEHALWIVNWMAHLAQRPHENPGVALVLRGEEGTGKGTLGRALMRMMRPHATQITHTKHLVGAFNAHLRDVLFMFADEAFFAGDRSQEGALKGLITEGYRVNESKGRDATLGLNRLHLMMASNNSFVVPASAEARRFAVFDVSNIHRQDQSYFKTVLDEMDPDGDAAGIAAMLWDLKRVPIDLDFLRKVPETEALRAQRLATLRGPAKWMLDVLSRGYIGDTFQTWEASYSTDDLFDSYKSWSRDARESFPAIRPEFGRFLSGMYSHHRPRQADGGLRRPPGYRLGDFAEARAVFAKKHGLGNPWPDDAPGDSASS